MAVMPDMSQIGKDIKTRLETLEKKATDNDKKIDDREKIVRDEIINLCNAIATGK